MGVPELILTLDLDWAPESAIVAVTDCLLAHDVRATFFVTHESPAVDRLREWPNLFELGLHPNFLPGSSHGSEPAAVLGHCAELVPEARCMRTHALVQSSPILDLVARETEIRTDVSLFLPGIPGRMFFPHGKLLRVPYAWEDDFEMRSSVPQWTPDHLREVGGTPVVLDFHPTLVALNATGTSAYRRLCERARLQDASASDLEALAHSGQGVGELFRGVVEQLAHGPTWRLCDLISAG